MSAGRAPGRSQAGPHPLGGSTDVRIGRGAVIDPPPLVWSFDGPFERCLADAEDTLRRAVVMVGDVARIAVLVELCLPALKTRFEAGDAVQPAWGHFLDSITRYGLPVPPRVRHLRGAGPLVTLVVAYRS